METKEKKAKGAKKDKGLKSANTGVRLIKTGNAKKANANKKLLGQLTEALGAGAYYELWSDEQYYSDKQIMLKAWFEGNDSDSHDVSIICDKSISKELRSAKSFEELNDLLDELQFADCYHAIQQATNSRREKMFDESGEPVMEDVYTLQFANSGADMSATRTKASGVANAEYKKEKKAFSFKAGGLY